MHPSSSTDDPFVPITLAPFVVLLDWLTLNVTLPVRLLDITRPVTWKWNERATDDRRLFLVPAPDGIRTRHWQRVVYLQDTAGVKLATLAGRPYSETIHRPDAGQLQFANVTLNTSADGRPLWLQLWNLFQRSGVTYRGISRIDIAMDGLKGNGGDFQRVVNWAVMDGAGRYYGKSNWMPRFHRSKVGAFEMGTRRSNKFLRCYNKTKELKQAGHAKEHIAQAWADRLGWSPLGEGETVNRFEVQLKGKEVRRYYPEERGDGILPMLGTQQYRAEVAASMARTLFDFRTHAERARDAVPLAVWDFSGVASDFVFSERERKRLQLSERTVKVACRALFFRWISSGDRSVYETARDMVHAAGLVAWWKRAQERWSKEAQSIKRNGGFNLFDPDTIGLGSEPPEDPE